jgi:dimethylsulfoniopropionate demethylase
MIRGVIFEGEPCPPCRQPWPVLVDNKKAGQITSAIWSPRFKANVSLGMIDMHYWDANQKVEVHSDTGTTWQGSVCYLPM